ncbi:hypothetical protein ACFSYD_21775 [Paracoccus aerius]
MLLALATLATLIVASFLAQATDWQNDVRAAMGMAPAPPELPS